MKRRCPVIVTGISRRFLWSAKCEQCPNWHLDRVTFRQYWAYMRMHAAAHNRRDA